MTDDYHPELGEYEPGDPRPSRSVLRRRVLRVMVVLGLTALILPGVLVTIRVQGTTAAAACRYVVQSEDTEAIGSTSRFELGGPDGPGWYCYAVRFGGAEILLRSLGLIPGLSPQHNVPAGVPA